MEKLDQLGEKIVHEPSTRELEKGLVKNEKASIIGRWKELLSNTDTAKQRYVRIFKLPVKVIYTKLSKTGSLCNAFPGI